jgi:hypothetical protein
MKHFLFILFCFSLFSSFSQDCLEGSYKIFEEEYRTKLEGSGATLIWTFERWGDCVCKYQLTRFKVEGDEGYYKLKKLSGPRACDDELSYVTIGKERFFGLWIVLRGYKQVWDAYDEKYKTEMDDVRYNFTGFCKK